RKIAFIRGSPDSRPSQEREAGFRRAFEQEGIALEGDMAAGAGWRLEDGYQAMRELLARESRYTAVFAASDLLALGAYQAIREAGLEVGKDISVLGFDNIELAAESLPPLSTVSVRRHEMGDTAARLLFESLDGGRGYPVRIVLPTVLVQRASTVAVPAVKGAATPGVVRKP
ncbi:MAG: substrate-binding domain-containing protein, partial [Bacillota bacterium]